MQIIEDVRRNETNFGSAALTVGSFDGVHLGHRRILDELDKAARRLGGVRALLTLRPHPREFFSPGSPPNILTSDQKKFTLLEEAGIEVLFILPFDEAVAELDREDFLREIVLNRCGASILVVGHDFAFGKDALGGHAYLQEAAPRFGLEVVQVPPLFIQGERVSSTRIREAILQGELDKAETLLARKYSVQGQVVPGRGVGVKLGFPTANIKPHNSSVPAHGVYAAEACHRGTRYPAAVNIGIAPTIRHADITLEAHLLDFDKDIIGDEIEVVFHKRLRPERKFPSLEALTAAIGEDVRAVRAYFADGT